VHLQGDGGVIVRGVVEDLGAPPRFLGVEAVRPALEAMGGTIVAAGYPFGGYGAVILLEVPDDTTATGIGLAIAAGGAFSPTATITRLLTGHEWLESLRKAQGSQYQPAR
jgi:uncharacterized protein with GYD domain